MTVVQRLRRRGLPCLTALTALIVLTGLAGCGGDSVRDSGTEGVIASSQASAGGSSSSAGAPATTPEPDVTVAETIIEVSVSNGISNPELGQVAVPLGNTVRLSVTSDVADEIHVHGYDLTFPLAPGLPASHEFVADVPGIFEVELHESGQLLFELRVE